MMFIYFADFVKNRFRYGVARKTGMDIQEIAKLIREVRPVIYGGRTIDADQMKVYIDKMNEIINHI